MKRFEGVDYMAFDTLLTEDEILIRDTVRDFVQEQVIPVIEEEFIQEVSPHHWRSEEHRLNSVT